MKTITNLSVWSALSLYGVSAAGGGKYNYKTNGADWKNDYPACGNTNQSPINLSTSKDAGYGKVSSASDSFTKTYSNQLDDVKVGWMGNTVLVNLEDGPNEFSSDLAEDVYGAVKEYKGAQFHFHAGSEHTVDGKRHDLEMHTVHLAHGEAKKDNEDDEYDDKSVTHAAMGLMFSVNDHTANLSDAQTKIVDDFFDSLQWDKQDDPKVPKVTYGDLMMMADMENRWIYKGSVTTPPCHTYVYWNVLKTIYPIKQKHLDLFVKQLERGEDGKLGEYGNWRETQPIDLHDIKSVEKSHAGMKSIVENFSADDFKKAFEKSNEWKCETAAINKDGVASDCGNILSETTGIPEMMISAPCCYTWTATVDPNKVEDEDVKKVSKIFEELGYPISPQSVPAHRCFNAEVLGAIPDFKFDDSKTNGSYSPQKGITYTVTCSGASMLYAGVASTVFALWSASI